VLRKVRRYWPVGVVVAVALGLLAAVLVAEHHGRGESYSRTNYSRIEDGLYLGGILEVPPPGTDAVLNVCETEDPYAAPVHRWRPIPDAAPAPSLDWLRDQAEFINTQRRAGRTVFVHCRAGLSRGPMVTAAYLMLRDRCSRDEALAALRARRPLVEPNSSFMQLLLEWEDALKRAAP
jgi:hypothetical protein